jgi:hypothetical protein
MAAAPPSAIRSAPPARASSAMGKGQRAVVSMCADSGQSSVMLLEAA